MFHSNYIPILHRLWDIVKCWPKIANLNLLHLYLAPPRGDPLKFRQDFWHQKTRVTVSYGIICVILRLTILVQCQLVTDTDRETDGQTHDDSKCRASIASRVNKINKSLPAGCAQRVHRCLNSSAVIHVALILMKVNFVATPRQIPPIGARVTCRTRKLKILGNFGI